ncbi:RagB/SusD family nutrient uptake outer membrane protein [Pedobacter gandavensis]|uniref:RagB/SusD family nutrient uptake outer membrane protein n=1 Tax=Pedobacter gandavensis TaxID=2679963 RepID=UPI00292F76B8|nr:RagB/SusD family nutrient uptake outer membrane protein [Pedobacter gandavensis]
MKNSKNILMFLPLALICCLTITGCKKFLDEKPDIKLAVPESLQDLQALLDNSGKMNTSGSNGRSTDLPEASSDNYQIDDESYESLEQGTRNIYIWGPEVMGTYASEIEGCWGGHYSVITPCNTVLKSIEGIKRTSANAVAYDNVKGSALFFRSNSFLWLVTGWSKTFNESSADQDPGIPLRKDDTYNEKVSRGTLRQTYDQIINDLNEALPLLPEKPVHSFRPSKAAVHALLARTYLAMRKYELAATEAKACIQVFGNNNLLNYNTLDATSEEPIARFNPEVIFSMESFTTTYTDETATVKADLYASYDDNDLRKTVFFYENEDFGGYSFKGHYAGYRLFTGLALDEVYLIAAESLIRTNKAGEGMDLLNELLLKRWATGSFAPLQITNPSDALLLVLKERRKELVMRNLRWMDLKRLNMEPEHQVQISRTIKGKIEKLEPGDPRYSFPIPLRSIQMSGLTQNPR